MDPDTARSTLGMLRGTTLTANDVEVANAQALRRTAQPAGLCVPAARNGHDLTLLRQLLEARAVLLDRSRRLPPRGEAIGRLTVIQFFIGGFALFATAIGLMIGWGTWYDGALSLIGWTIGAVSIAVTSMIVTLLVGLPLRLGPTFRSRWLANGELTLAGAILGFVATEIVIAAAPVSTVVDEFGPYQARREWLGPPHHMVAVRVLDRTLRLAAALDPARLTPRPATRFAGCAPQADR